MDKDSRLSFSIRKLTIGAVSVMFGAVIFGVSANQVKADETAQPTTEQTAKSATDTATKQTNNQQTSTTNQIKEDQKQTTSTKTEAKAQEVESSISLNGQNVDGNPITVDFNNTKTGNVTITFKNNTGAKQSINKLVQLPEFDGTDNAFHVDKSASQNGKIVFSGDYATKGLSLDRFDIATGTQTSTGFNKSEQDASNDASLIGGFGISGELNDGEEATIVVPVVFNDIHREGVVPAGSLGFYDEKSSPIRLRLARSVTTLANEEGKRYFLVDNSKSSDGNYYSVDQSVLDYLEENSALPTYQNGDIAIGNTFDSYYNESLADTNTTDLIYYNDAIFYANALNRLNASLNKIGYKVVHLENVGFNADHNEYDLKDGYKYFNANGQEIQLGQNGLSNFMIAIEKDPNFKKDNESTTPIVTPVTPVTPDVTPVTPVKPIIAPVHGQTNPDNTTKKATKKTKKIIAPVHANVNPDKAVKQNTKKAAVKVVSPQGQLTTVSATTVNKSNANTLPQTGENKTNLSVIGLLVSALALFGLAVNPKKNN